MKEYACQIVPIYVRPQTIVEEKACIGVVVRCPEANVAEWRVVDDNSDSFERIAQFFPRFGRENLMQALAWARQDVAYALSGTDSAIVEQRFANLIRPREHVVQYGASWLSITTTPDQELDKVYRAIVA